VKYQEEEEKRIEEQQHRFDFNMGIREGSLENFV
jgi:hypothetical protein